MKPKVLAAYKERVSAIELQEHLKTMVPVQDEEDVNSDQEEEKKTEEKKLYEVDHVYRT